VNFTPEVIEKLAEAAHEIWKEAKFRDGWSYATITNKEKKEHSCLIPYKELNEADEQSDRDLAAGIPAILEKAGYEIIPSKKAKESKI